MATFHRCDRCKAVINGELYLYRITLIDVFTSRTRHAKDLCGECAEKFELFMHPDPDKGEL